MFFECCLKRLCGQDGCRCVMITINIPLTLVGLMVTGVFAYSKILIRELSEKSDVVSTAQRSIESVIVLGIVVGVLVTTSGVLGCLGATLESRNGIMAHLVFLVMVMVLEVGATVALFFIRSTIYNTVKEADLEEICKYCAELLTEDSGALQVIGWALLGSLIVHVVLFVVSSTFLCVLRRIKKAHRVDQKLQEVSVTPGSIPLQTALPVTLMAMTTLTSPMALDDRKHPVVPPRKMSNTKKLYMSYDTRNGECHPKRPLLYPDINITGHLSEQGQFVNPPFPNPPDWRSIVNGRPCAPVAPPNSGSSSTSANRTLTPPPPPPPPPSTPVRPFSQPPVVGLGEIQRALEARRQRLKDSYPNLNGNQTTEL